MHVHESYLVSAAIVLVGCIRVTVLECATLVIRIPLGF